MSQTSQKDFKVAVIGCDVCGLTCTTALQKAGVIVDLFLFEAAAAFGELGAAIGLGTFGVAIYRGLIPLSQLQATGFKALRPSKHVVVVAVNGCQLTVLCTFHEQINVAALVTQYNVAIGSQALPDGTPWVGEVSRDDIQRDFEGWGPDVVTLLRCMPEKIGHWSIHVEHPLLAGYSGDHVAIVCDTAHAKLPHLGAGSEQGLEDVRLLTRPETQSSNIAAVLDAYSTTRRPHYKGVWDASYNAGAVYNHHGPHDATSEAILQDLQGMWDPVWGYDLDAEYTVAVAMV